MNNSWLTWDVDVSNRYMYQENVPYEENTQYKPTIW